MLWVFVHPCLLVVRRWREQGARDACASHYTLSGGDGTKCQESLFIKSFIQSASVEGKGGVQMCEPAMSDGDATTAINYAKKGAVNE